MIYLNFLISLFTSVSIAASSVSFAVPISFFGNPLAGEKAAINAHQTNVPDVPFYSQFSDIHAAEWQKLGCGIAALAMLIEFYKPGIVSVNTLLKEGIAAGAFINGAGWSHKGLALLAGKYGLEGANYDFSRLDTNTAFAQFEKFLKEGPVIASVHYTLRPENPIPHLVVINGINDGVIYYNDPAEASVGKTISIPDFIKAWKKRFIVVRL
jgi:ABC-type bacteriocin/lantibiotic exporter with double-glycine peptidase domain